MGPCPHARPCVGWRVCVRQNVPLEKILPHPMQTLRRNRCQTRTRPRKKACVYGVRVSGATIFVYPLNPKQSIDPFGLMEVLARQLPSGDSMGEYRYYFDFNCGPGCVEGRAIFDATAGRLSRLLSNAGKIEKRTKSTAGLSDIENYQDRLTCSKHEKSLEEKFKELGHKPGLLGSGSSFTEAQAREVMNKLGEQLPRDIKDKYGWNTIIDRAKERARPTLTTIPR